MNANRVILAGVVALAAAGLLALGLSGGNTGPDVNEIGRAKVDEVVVQPREPGKPKPAGGLHKRIGSNGQEVVETMKTLRAEGLPERPPTGSPLDEGTWDDVRREADEQWHKGMMDGAEHWAAKNGYDRQDRLDLVDQVAQFTKSVVTVREDMRSGRVDPKIGRQKLEDLRYDMAARMITNVGKDESEDLRDYLAETTAGGGW